MAKFCSECGTSLDAADRFCTSCGARTIAEAPAPPVVGVAPAAAAAAAAAPVASAAPVAPVAAVAPASAARPARAESAGLPFARQILTALVWGAFAGAAGYVHGRMDTAVTWGLAVAVATFAVLLALGALRTLLAAPFRRGRTGAARGAAIGIGTIVALLLTGSVVGAAAWVAFPDLPPRAFDLEALSAQVTSALPLPAREGAPAERRVGLRGAAVAADPVPLEPDDELAARVLAQLRGSGLAVSSVGIVEAPSGQRVMVVGVDASQLGPDLNAGLSTLIRLAQDRALPVGEVDSVAVAIHDEGGRAIFSMSASTSEIESFRSGASDRRAFIRGMALRTESRLGLLDAYRDLAGR